MPRTKWFCAKLITKNKGDKMKVDSINEVSSNDLKFSTKQIMKALAVIFDCDEIVILTGKLNKESQCFDAGVHSYCSDIMMIKHLIEAAAHTYSHIKNK